MKRGLAPLYLARPDKRGPGSRPALAASFAALLVLSACQGARPGSTSQAASTASATPAVSETAAPASPSPDANVWSVVALGDSEVTGSGDQSGKGWVPYYAELIRAGSGREVTVLNLGENGLTSSGLLSSVGSNTGVRDAIAKADIVVLGIGGADVNAGDDALASGSCESTACYDATISEYALNVDAIAAEIMNIRGGKPTVLRSITQPNVLTGAEDVIPPFLRNIATEVGVYVARGFNKATCDAMTAHGGACIDILTAINGPDGEGDGYKAGLLNLDDCCYPNEQGHRLMADLLYATGLAPLEGPTARR
jgi:lysophospholipase L1-like esterase